MSAPSASGCCRYGLANVLSTTTSAPAACARSAIAAMSTILSSGLDGVSSQTRSAGSLEGLARDALVGQVEELVAVALRRVQLREQPVGAAVDVVDRDGARAGREQLHDRGRRAHPGREADAVRAALERGQALLERRARRVDRAGVVVPAAHLQHAVLRVRAGLVDRHVDRARQRDRAPARHGSRASQTPLWISLLSSPSTWASRASASRSARGRCRRCQCTARARSVPALRSAFRSTRPTTSGPSSSGST